MDNIKFSLFDVFAYAIPGAIALFAGIILFNPTITQLSDIGGILQNISIGGGLVAIVASYVIGFAVDSPGTWIYSRVGCKIWGKPYNKASIQVKPSIARTLVRHYSSENQSYIQTWKVLKTMSHNLALSSIILSVVSIIQVTRNQQYQEQWLTLALVSATFVVVFLHRASVFDKWHYDELVETVKSLHLEQRAINDAKKEGNNKQSDDLLKKLLNNE